MRVTVRLVIALGVILAVDHCYWSQLSKVLTFMTDTRNEPLQSGKNINKKYISKALSNLNNFRVLSYVSVDKKNLIDALA